MIVSKKDRLERSKVLESEVEWLLRERDETQAHLDEVLGRLAQKTEALEQLGCDFQTDSGLPCREQAGRRARVVDVVGGVACCERHAEIRKYSLRPPSAVA
jgi:hypothetical protein